MSAQIQGAGFTALMQAFATAKASKLKWPKLNFDRFVFSMASDTSKNPGCLYIKGGRDYEAEYFGKVSPDGRFWPSQACPREVEQQILAIGADPLGMAVAHGRRTGNCCACGRPLEDAKSVEMGIGPICRKKWFGSK